MQYAKKEGIESSLAKLSNIDKDLTNEIGIETLSFEEQYAVYKFKETIIRQPDGRFVVQPMLKKDLCP